MNPEDRLVEGVEDAVKLDFIDLGSEIFALVLAINSESLSFEDFTNTVL